MKGGRSHWRRLPAGILAAVVITPAAGCGGSDRAYVTGQITLANGQPCTNGSVLARSSKTGKWASGVTDATGRFELGTAQAGDGIPPGDYYVTIREVFPETDKPPRPTIPAKYADPSLSKLELHLAPGESETFDVKLDPK
jgi:hypothetical protein